VLCESLSVTYMPLSRCFHQSALNSSSADPSFFDLGPACEAAAVRDAAGDGPRGQQVLLPAIVFVEPAFRAVTASGSLSCRVFGAGGRDLIAELMQPLVVKATSWPLASDTMIVSGRADALSVVERWRTYSSQLGAPSNATLAASALARCGACPAGQRAPLMAPAY